MKANRDPILNNYLTIHVPAASHLQEFAKRKRKPCSEYANPLMNKKLKEVKSPNNKIACVYRNASNKVLKNRKRVESIPLLKNLKVHSVNKIGIVKETDKKFYNIIFTKKPLESKGSIQETSKQNERKIQTHGSKRNERLMSPSRNDMKRSVSNFSELRVSTPIKISSTNWP